MSEKFTKEVEINKKQTNFGAANYYQQIKKYNCELQQKKRLNGRTKFWSRRYDFFDRFFYFNIHQNILNTYQILLIIWHHIFNLISSTLYKHQVFFHMPYFEWLKTFFYTPVAWFLNPLWSPGSALELSKNVDSQLHLKPEPQKESSDTVNCL